MHQASGKTQHQEEHPRKQPGGQGDLAQIRPLSQIAQWKKRKKIDGCAEEETAKEKYAFDEAPQAQGLRNGQQKGRADVDAGQKAQRQRETRPTPAGPMADGEMRPFSRCQLEKQNRGQRNHCHADRFLEVGAVELSAEIAHRRTDQQIARKPAQRQFADHPGAPGQPFLLGHQEWDKHRRTVAQAVQPGRQTQHEAL